MENDNSRLAGVCNKWGRENGVYSVGKWGHGEDQGRLYNYPAFKQGEFHWTMIPYESKFLCDDRGPAPFEITSGDFWKVFAR